MTTVLVEYEGRSIGWAVFADKRCVAVYSSEDEAKRVAKSLRLSDVAFRTSRARERDAAA